MTTPAYLADPRILTVIFTAIGGALGWLWKLFKNLNDKINECEKDRALDKQEIGRLQGSVETLLQLLKVETKIG